MLPKLGIIKAKGTKLNIKTFIFEGKQYVFAFFKSHIPFVSATIIDLFHLHFKSMLPYSGKVSDKLMFGTGDIFCGLGTLVQMYFEFGNFCLFVTVSMC